MSLKYVLLLSVLSLGLVACDDGDANDPEGDIIPADVADGQSDGEGDATVTMADVTETTPDVTDPDTTDPIDASDTVETNDAADAADMVTGCTADLGGLYATSGMCGQEPFNLPGELCVFQTECELTVYTSSQQVLRGPVAGDTGSVNLDPAQGLAPTCDASQDANDALALQCEFGPDNACESVGTRVDTQGVRPCCDVSAADQCGDGERCQVARLNGTITTGCIADTGTGQLGEACTRTDGLGFDTCAEGLLCANWGSPDPMQRTCTQLCTASSQCPTDESCLVVSDLPLAGSCGQQCDPFAAPGEAGSCPQDTFCHLVNAIGDSGFSSSTGCFSQGADLAEGEACTGARACADGFHCDGECRRECDTENPCPMGQTCEPVRSSVAGFPDGFGLCR